MQQTEELQQKEHLIGWFLFIGIAVALLVFLYLYSSSETTKIVALFMLALVITLAAVFSYTELIHAPGRLSRKIIELTFRAKKESARELKDKYIGIHHLYMKLPHKHKQKFHPKITALRETLEKQLQAEKKIEKLLSEEWHKDVNKMRERYKKVHLYFQQLPANLQKKHYTQIISLREKLEREIS